MAVLLSTKQTCTIERAQCEVCLFACSGPATKRDAEKHVRETLHPVKYSKLLGFTIIPGAKF